jgi:hypothetical protein
MRRIQRPLKLMGLAALLTVALAVPGYTETPIETAKAKIRNVLMTRDFNGEYIQTIFQFGRRQESSYQIWVKGMTRLRQTQSPAWQRGEVVSENERGYIYYVPVLNAGLKEEKSRSAEEVRLADWKDWVDNLQKFEEQTANYAQQPAQLFTGKYKDISYKLWVLRDNYLPVALEASRNRLIIRTIRFTQLSPYNSALNPNSFIRGNVKWFTDEMLFWKTISIPRIRPGVSFTILQPAYLPAGYVFRRATIEELSSATVAHLLYEGPNHTFISLFEREKLSDKQRYDLESLKEELPDGKVIQTYQWITGPVHLALLGPVSLDELKKIAASMR